MLLPKRTLARRSDRGRPEQRPISPFKSDASRFYFFLPDPKFGCHPVAPPFWLGAAAIVLIFSFLGFLDSRFPFFSPLAMSISFGLMMPSLRAEFHIVP